MLSRPRLGPSRLQGFLFDLDGTLVQTPIDFKGMKRGVLDLAAAAGLDPESLTQYDILGIIAQAERELAGAALPEPFRERAEALLIRYEIEAASVAEELPGAVKTLTELKRQGKRVAIVTRNSRIGAETALRRAPLPHDLLLTRNDVPKTKPDPEHLLEAARRIGLEPEACAMVGDHPMDMQAGRAAGMFCIAVQTRDPSPGAFSVVDPDVILPCAGDLLSWMSASLS
jgi:phosphoglycolate phosphatase